MESLLLVGKFGECQKPVHQEGGQYELASDYGAGGRVARKCNEINEKRFQRPLLDWEVGQSSTYREVKSMEMGINLVRLMREYVWSRG